MAQSVYSKLILIILLILANSFFVASEFSMVRVRKTRLEQLILEGNATAKIALKLAENINDMLAAAQLGITLASVALGWVGAKTLDTILTPIIRDILPFESAAFCTILTFAISFITVTFFEVLIGEQLPKCISLQNTEKVALFVARPMQFVMKLFKPFVWFLSTCSTAILNALNINTSSNDIVHTTEELDMLVDASYNEGELNKTEAEMLHNMFNFSDLTAKQVMTPRTDMMCIEAIKSIDEIKKFTAENQYTRYPVYEETIDKILGFVHVKDLYTKLLENTNIELKDIIRPILLVPETMTLDNLVIEFRKRKSQIGIVVDEFGGTSGLITLEDIIEEIVGDVQDEFDTDEEADIVKTGENEYIANGIMRIDEFANYFSREIPEEEDVETIAGIILKRLDRMAEVGDSVDFDNFTLTVEELDGTRIVKIKVTEKNSETEEPQEQETKE